MKRYLIVFDLMGNSINKGWSFRRGSNFIKKKRKKKKQIMKYFRKESKDVCFWFLRVEVWENRCSKFIIRLELERFVF